MAAEAGIELEVHWHSYELDQTRLQNMRTQYGALSQKYGRSYADMEEMERNVAAMAATEGIDFQWQKSQSQATASMHTASSIWHRARVWAMRRKRPFPCLYD